MYTPRGLQYILQVYCYNVEVCVQYGHILQFLRHWSITGRDTDAILHCAVYNQYTGSVYMQDTLKAAVYGILNWQYILQVHCIDGSIPSVYTAAY